ncbi:MAG: ABC-2 transporter permease [Defluviitaleaceae bacterium]|nr:ABC-2 transporter permease [Defluviitaleaceae bacterium]
MMTIAKKELRGYFNSMMGFVYLAITLILMGVMFGLICVYSSSGNFQNVLSSATIIFLFLIPIITMRLFAEESRQKTDQMLFTAPVSIVRVVLGKYLAAMALVMIGVIITAFLPIMVSPYGTMPTREIISGYIGYILLAACFTAVGTFVSTLTDNQIVSAIVSIFIFFVFMIFDSIVSIIPSTVTASVIFLIIVVLGLGWLVYSSTRNLYAGLIFAGVCIVAVLVCYLINNLIFDGLTVKVLNWFSIMSRNTNFFNGVFNLSDIVYHITFAAAFLYLAVNVLQKRRWK